MNASRICVSSLRRGHANLLCIVPILVYVLPKQVQKYCEITGYIQWIYFLITTIAFSACILVFSFGKCTFKFDGSETWCKRSTSLLVIKCLYFNILFGFLVNSCQKLYIFLKTVLNSERLVILSLYSQRRMTSLSNKLKFSNR